MRRVVVTGLGAVTPIGNDAPSSWRAAVAGESGVDWIRSFDANGFPVRIAAEVKDWDPTAVASPKEVRKLERNVLLALGAAREAVADAGIDGAYEPGRVGILFGTAARTTRRSRRARPARTRSARRRSSSAAATPTRCSPAAPRRACIP